MNTFLKRLELQGFKSFAQKTVFEFPARVTAIVGPNGSGKSNVIDAFRWVLGEREAKQLRGDTLDNLIFAGTPKRPASSLAKVGLYFDNHNQVFEQAGNEAMLVRRVDRSGVSQFLFHDTEVKLKDLLPMLARARLGARGLTMVGQGQSDIFVKSNPNERRAMIEEVLGLREFRIKKSQSERRLLNSTVNMEKVKAMLEELTPHLRLLRRQRTRWEKRSEIADELLAIENRYFGYRYSKLKNEQSSIGSMKGDDGTERVEQEREIERLEKSIATIDQRARQATVQQTWRDEITKLLGERSQKEKELARFEAKIEFLTASTTDEQRATHLVTVVQSIIKEMNEARMWGDLEKVTSAINVWRTTMERAVSGKHNEEIETLHHSGKKIAQELQTIDSRITALREEEVRASTEQQKINQEFRDQVQKLEEKKNEMRRIEERMQREQFEREKIALRMDELTREWENIGRDRHSLATLSVPEVEVDLQGDERRMLKFRGELSAIGEIDEGLVKEAEETEERYQFLERESNDFTRASADLEKLIKDLDHKIHDGFKSAFRSINEEFNNYFRLMFGGGKAHLALVKQESREQGDQKTNEEGNEDGEQEGKATEIKQSKEDAELTAGIVISVSLPRKRITSLEMLSGGERSLVSIAALFALIAVSPPPFLVLDEIDAALDEENARRFAELVKEFSKKTQFIIVTHNRATMEAADVLYGVTMGDDGISKVLSMKMEA